MAAVVEILPRISRAARRYSRVSNVSAEDLESCGVLAVLERQAKLDDARNWRSLALKIAIDGMRDEVRRSIKFRDTHSPYGALSATDTVSLLSRQGVGGIACRATQLEDAYVSQVMSRLDAPDVGRDLLAAGVKFGPVSCDAIAIHGRRKRKSASGRELRRAFRAARQAAATVVDAEK